VRIVPLTTNTQIIHNYLQINIVRQYWIQMPQSRKGEQQYP
jgi:hypothetical protein